MLDFRVPEKSLVKFLRRDDRREGEGENGGEAFSLGGVLKLGFKDVVSDGGDSSLTKEPVADNVEMNSDGFGGVEDDDANGDAALGGESEEGGARGLGGEGLIDDDRETRVKEDASGVKDLGGRLERIEIGDGVVRLRGVASREEGLARAGHTAHEEYLLRGRRGKRERGGGRRGRGVPSHRSNLLLELDKLDVLVKGKELGRRRRRESERLGDGRVRRGRTVDVKDGSVVVVTRRVGDEGSTLRRGEEGVFGEEGKTNVVSKATVGGRVISLASTGSVSNEEGCRR